MHTPAPTCALSSRPSVSRRVCRNAATASGSPVSISRSATSSKEGVAEVTCGTGSGYNNSKARQVGQQEVGAGASAAWLLHAQWCRPQWRASGGCESHSEPGLHFAQPALTLPYSAAACTYSPSSKSEAASARYTLLRWAALWAICGAETGAPLNAGLSRPALAPQPRVPQSMPDGSAHLPKQAPANNATACSSAALASAPQGCAAHTPPAAVHQGLPVVAFVQVHAPHVALLTGGVHLQRVIACNEAKRAGAAGCTHTQARIKAGRELTAWEDRRAGIQPVRLGSVSQRVSCLSETEAKACFPQPSTQRTCQHIDAACQLVAAQAQRHGGSATHGRRKPLQRHLLHSRFAAMPGRMRGSRVEGQQASARATIFQ